MLMFSILAVAVFVFAFFSSRYFTNPRLVAYSIVSMYVLGLSIFILNDSKDLKMASLVVLLLTGAYNYWYIEVQKGKKPDQ